MGFAFNPFTGNFDQKGSGGGASYIDGEEATYNDLSLDAGVAPLNSAWLVRSSSGIWPFNKPGGIYIRTATGGVSRDADYTYAGTMPDVFSDAVLTIYDEASTTRTGQFNLGSITAGQNRVLTWPNASGTIARTEDFAAPPAIGNTTANAGSFTTLSATPPVNTSALTSTGYSLTGSNAQSLVNLVGTWNTTGTPTAFRLNITNTASNASSLLADFQVGGNSQFRVRRAGGVEIGGAGSGVRITDYMIQGLGGGLNIQSANTNTGFVLDSGNITTLGCSIFEQRSGSTAQIFRLFTTYNSGTSFERLSLRGQTSNNFIIATEKGTTGGAARGLEFRTDSATRLTLGDAGGVTIADANNIAVGTTTGTKIGTATNQKIGFFNATPVVQQAAIADATDAATTQARLNDLLATMRTFGLIAT